MVISLFFNGCKSHYSTTFGIQDVKKLFASNENPTIIEKNNQKVTDSKVKIYIPNSSAVITRINHTRDETRITLSFTGSPGFYTGGKSAMKLNDSVFNYFILDGREYHYNSNNIKRIIAKAQKIILVFNRLTVNKFSLTGCTSSGCWNVYEVDSKLSSRVIKNEIKKESVSKSNAEITINNKYSNLPEYADSLVGASLKAWSKIDYVDFYHLISGNTLIGKSKIFCPKSSSKDSCLKIAILSKVTPPIGKIDLGRHSATVIYPDKKKIYKSEWGYYAVDVMHIGIHTGIIDIPTNSNSNRWDEIIAVNNEKNMIKVSNGDIEILISIQKGQNRKFITDAQNGNYKKVDSTGSQTIGQALLGVVTKKVGESLAKIGKNNVGNDMKYNCYANVENKISWCYGIKDEDMQNSCYANVENEISRCYGIKDEDMKNSCYANVENEISWCYGIKDEDMKNSCYANVENEISWCYSISE